jgi:hypothetical protein
MEELRMFNRLFNPVGNLDNAYNMLSGLATSVPRYPQSNYGCNKASDPYQVNHC